MSNAASAAMFLYLLAAPLLASGTEIRQQKFNMESPPRGEVRSELLLENEVPEVEATHLTLAGPISRTQAPTDEHAEIFLFLKGSGSLRFGEQNHEIVPETIAMPISSEEISIDVPEDEILHYVRIRKKFSEQDFEDIKGFTSRADGGIYFKTFEDCQAYREAIKSPKTVSRTVLPNQIIPRVAVGTVQTTGPDEVGAHRHPMLDQMFLALADNDVVVTADDTHARFTEFSLLHIPLGSLHGVKAEPGTKMYYMWMDFFLTKEGEEWLKTHKPVTE